MKKTRKQSSHKKARRVIFPPSITQGDTIGLVAPAGPIINKSNFSAGVRILEKYGFTSKRWWQHGVDTAACACLTSST